MDLSWLRKELTIVFQPIHNLVLGEITGFEALARTPAHSPNSFLRLAKRKRILNEVEMCCFQLAVEESVILTGSVFFNFSPSTIIKYYDEIIKCLRNMRGRAVIELIEYAMPERARHELLGAIGELQGAGLKIALDDVGNGDRDFCDICELPADFMKIDRRIIKGLTKLKNGSASRYQIILNTLVSLSRKLNMSIIAEGIETKNQYAGVTMSGIHLAQGFYLSKPRPAICWHSEMEKKKRYSAYR